MGHRSIPIAQLAFRVADPVAVNGAETKTLEDSIFAAMPGHRLVFVNGHFEPALSAYAGLPAEVSVLTLAEALKTIPEFVMERLGTLAAWSDAPFTAMNTAFVQDGVVIHVPNGTVIDEPIHIIHVADAHAEGGAIFPRLLVVAEELAQVTSTLKTMSDTGQTLVKLVKL